jgi:hypothetical protein
MRGGLLGPATTRHGLARRSPTQCTDTASSWTQARSVEEGQRRSGSSATQQWRGSSLARKVDLGRLGEDLWGRVVLRDL